MTIQTQSQANRDLRLAAREGLLPARGSNWLAGFNNLLTKELGEWFHTRRWLWQLLIWIIILDGFIAMLLFVLPWLASNMPGLQPAAESVFSGLPPDVGSVMMYFNIIMMAGPIGVIILAQDEIIQEKQTGTAAWVISKPVARSAFILAKLLSNMVCIVIFIVGVPSLILLGEIYLATHQIVPLLPFLAGVGLILLGLFFYLSLVILLGVLYESRGPVLGIAFGIMLGGMMFRNFIPQILYILPSSMEATAFMVVQRMPMNVMAVSQVISTGVLSILFVLVGLWRFQNDAL